MPEALRWWFLALFSVGIATFIIGTIWFRGRRGAIEKKIGPATTPIPLVMQLVFLLIPGSDKQMVSEDCNPGLDPYIRAYTTLTEAVFDGPGESGPEWRRAATKNERGPEDLRALVDKIHRHAYKVTDEDVLALKAKHSEDVLFEVIVSAAVGAAEQRLLAGLRALEEAT